MDLWPENLLDDFENVKAPSNLLKEQGAKLGEKTQNLVEGVVRRIFDDPYDQYDDKFDHVFSIYAPTIKYSYDLLKISYDIPFYPVGIEFEGDTTSHDNEEDFTNKLREIFASAKTKRVIQALLAQLEYRPPIDAHEREEDIPF